MLRLRSLTAALLAGSLWLACAAAFAEAPSDAAALELSRLCSFESAAQGRIARLTDGSYRAAFTAPDGWLAITAPEGQTISWLYLCFGELPAAWEVQEPFGDGWRTFFTSSNNFAHVAVAVPALSRVRVQVTKGALSLHEARVFAAGALPPDVQQWQPTPDKADLMVLAAHPDDEFLFFGGLIPWYVHQGKAVLPVYMTCRDATRRSELLNGLWAAGQRAYPVIGGFPDRYQRDVAALLNLWTREEVDYFLASLLRRYRPEVLVTHGTGGEYGHAAHKICADALTRMFDRAADPYYLPQLTNRYGVWQPKKLYLHQDGAAPVRMDWQGDAGGLTALESALKAFAQHESQQHFRVQHLPGDPYSCYDFGLVRSTVGADKQKNDLFENVSPGAN